MRPRDTALQFVHRFAAADIDGLSGLLAEDLELAGPFLEVDSRDDYLDALLSDPPEPGEVRVLDVAEQGDEVTVRYEYVKSDGALEVEQWFDVGDGVIRRTRLTFEASS